MNVRCAEPDARAPALATTGQDLGNRNREKAVASGSRLLTRAAEETSGPSGPVRSDCRRGHGRWPRAARAEPLPESNRAVVVYLRPWVRMILGVDDWVGWDDPAELRVRLDMALEEIAGLSEENRRLRALLGPLADSVPVHGVDPEEGPPGHAPAPDRSTPQMLSSSGLPYADGSSGGQEKLRCSSRCSSAGPMCSPGPGPTARDARGGARQPRNRRGNCARARSESSSHGRTGHCSTI